MSDFHRRLVTGNTHVIVLTETGPRIFEIRCTACHTAGPHERCDAGCHRVTWTPWGEALAHEIGELHIFYMENPAAPRLHQMTVMRTGRYR